MPEGCPNKLVLVTNRQHEVQISACYKVRNFLENMMFLNCTVLELLNLMFLMLIRARGNPLI